MKFSETFTSKDSTKLDKETLLILRWIALSGQFFTIILVKFIFNFKLELSLCLSIIAIGVLSNFYLKFKIKEKQLDNYTSTIFLFYDLLQLAILLYLTGGITNPFTILLIIPAIVSSTFLTLRSTINLSIITILALVIITIDYYPLPHTGDLHFHDPHPTPRLFHRDRRRRKCLWGISLVNLGSIGCNPGSTGFRWIKDVLRKPIANPY